MGSLPVKSVQVSVSHARSGSGTGYHGGVSTSRSSRKQLEVSKSRGSSQAGGDAKLT